MSNERLNVGRNINRRDFLKTAAFFAASLVPHPEYIDNLMSYSLLETSNGVRLFFLNTAYPGCEGKYAETINISKTGKIWKQQEWLPINPKDLPPYDPYNNNPSSYMRVVMWFNVADPDNGRYSISSETTFCNIFVSDVTMAMSCPIPRIENGNKLRAKDYHNWLSDPERGGRVGWKKAFDGREAQEIANEGLPVVATFYKIGYQGHVAMVIPGEGEEKNGLYYPNSAQAGLTNFVGRSVYQGFRIDLMDKKINYFFFDGYPYRFIDREEFIRLSSSG